MAPTAPLTSPRATPFRLGVDLDGVLYPFADAFAVHAERVLGVEPGSLPPPTTWRFYTEQWGLDVDSFHALYRSGVSSGSLFTAGIPDSEVLDALATLARHDVELHVVTARLVDGVDDDLVIEQTRQWLAGIDLPLASVHVVRGSKLPIATTLGLNAHLDDAPHHLSELAGACTPIAWHKPWNAHLDATPDASVGSCPGLCVARSGDDLIDVVRSLAGFVEVPQR